MPAIVRRGWRSDPLGPPVLLVCGPPLTSHRFEGCRAGSGRIGLGLALPGKMAVWERRCRTAVDGDGLLGSTMQVMLPGASHLGARRVHAFCQAEPKVLRRALLLTGVPRGLQYRATQCHPRTLPLLEPRALRPEIPLLSRLETRYPLRPPHATLGRAPPEPPGAHAPRLEEPPQRRA